MTAVTTSVLRDSSIITWRNLLNIRRIPDLLLGATVQPIMFVLLFAYVFAGSLGGAAYREFLIGGIFAQTVAFNAAFTTMGLANDLHKGIIDRFRTLPISRLAVILGRTTSDLGVNVITLMVMSLTGLVVGWRIHSGFAAAAAGYLVLLLFAFAMSWVGALVGLLCRTVEVAQSAGLIWLFPLTFISSAFVPTGNMLLGRLPTDRAVEGAHLRTRQYPDRAGTLLSKVYVGDRGAHQPQHRVSDFGEQPANDVFATLVQYHLDQRLAGHGLHDPESVDCHRAVVEVHSGAQCPAQRPRDRTWHLGQIGLEHPVGRVHQPVRQVSVVGQQEQTLGVGVEATDVEQSLRPVSHVVADTGSAAVVGHRGVHAARLVQRQVLHVGTQFQAHAVDVDDRVVGVDPHPHLAHHDPVHLDPATRDHRFGSAPGGHSSLGEHLVQPGQPRG
jgi:ABC-2 type transport system permease protein